MSKALIRVMYKVPGKPWEARFVEPKWSAMYSIVHGTPEAHNLPGGLVAIYSREYKAHQVIVHNCTIYAGDDALEVFSPVIVAAIRDGEYADVPSWCCPRTMDDMCASVSGWHPEGDKPLHGHNDRSALLYIRDGMGVYHHGHYDFASECWVDGRTCCTIRRKDKHGNTALRWIEQ